MDIIARGKINKYINEISEESRRKNKIRNQLFRDKLEINPVKIIIEQEQLRWLSHIMRRVEDKLIRQKRGKLEEGKERSEWKK